MHRDDRGASRRELLRLIAAFVALHAAMAGARMAAPLLALADGRGNAAAGFLVALFALTQIFLSLPAGRYADRHGLKRPLGFSILATAAGVGLAAAWPIYEVLCVSALLCGGAVGTATIALQRHVGRMASSPAELKLVFSWLATAPAIANFLGPTLAGLAIDLAGFRAGFTVLAVMPVIAWLVMRGIDQKADRPALAAPTTAAWELLRDPAMRRVLLMNWFMTSSWDLHGFVVPVLGHERGLSATTIGAILGSFALSAAFIRGIIPFFARRLREWVLITAATAIAGAAFLLYPLTSSALAMGACSAILGMSLGAVNPMVMSLLHQLTPDDRHGEAVALRVIMINVSSVAMPLLFGVAGGALGVSVVFWTMGAVVGLGSRLGVALREVRVDDPSQ